MLRDISLHIHDLSENSISAGATLLKCQLKASDNILYFNLIDNGKGMDSDMLSKVEDPFTTSRTTRKVGMGIPFIKLACEQSGGSFRIESRPGVGTTLYCTFIIDNIDRLPLGDIGETVSMILLESPDLHLIFELSSEKGEFAFDTNEIKEAIGDDDLTDADTLQWIKEYFAENVSLIFGGILNEID